MGPRFLAGIRGSPQKIRLRWVPVSGTDRYRAPIFVIVTMDIGYSGRFLSLIFMSSVTSSVRYGTRLGDLKNKQSTHTGNEGETRIENPLTSMTLVMPPPHVLGE